MSQSTPPAKLDAIPLGSLHSELGAQMGEFAGFEMPIKYEGISDEHLAVRNDVGLFDISHMGEIEVVGENAVTEANSVVANDLKRIEDGAALYTVICNEDGGILDDCVVYRLSPQRVMCCANAANIERDYEVFDSHTSNEVQVVNSSREYAQFAVQGPKSEALLQEMTEFDCSDLGRFRSTFGRKGLFGEVIVSRTGYTGEDGFELYVPVQSAERVFEALRDTGSDYDLAVCGLGARDSLRIEAMLHLYGQDIDETTNPYEAGLGWTVKLDKDESFIGRSSLESLSKAEPKRVFRSFALQQRRMLRTGHEVLSPNGEAIGTVTSGAWSPVFKTSVGLGYIDREFKDVESVDIQIRDDRIQAKVSASRLYSRT